MLTRRKRPINLSKQQKNQPNQIPQFKPKQSLPPLDLLADFQFTTKSSIKLKEIHYGVLFKDLYPYFAMYSVTACYIWLIVVGFLWTEFHSQKLKINKLLDPQQTDIASFWTRVTICFVFINFMLMHGAYLESIYKLWYFLALGLTHFVAFIVFEMKGSVSLNGESHIYTAVYSTYWLILVEKRMQSVNLNQMWIKFKTFPIWEKLYSLGNKKAQPNNPDLIDFAFTQRPLSIKGGETDDSFSYDSFFSYSDPFDLSESSTHKGYFQSNISKRSSNISHQPEPKKPSPSYYSKFLSQKSILQQGEIQSTIASSESLKKEKLQQQVQLIKIYKCFILSFLVYSTVSKVEWIGYLVTGCVLLACVEVLTNERLKFVKFGCFLFLAVFVVAWM